VIAKAGVIETEIMLERMKRLPVRLRIVHLAALLRSERQANGRERPLPSTASRREESNTSRGRAG
jgi:hypothetical protein